LKTLDRQCDEFGLRFVTMCGVSPCRTDGFALKGKDQRIQGHETKMDVWTPRQSDIVTLARTEGKVSVEDLAERFNVTPQTIRKDLNDLCDSGLLQRFHGGAVLARSAASASRPPP
jgi:hypothetical protein